MLKKKLYFLVISIILLLAIGIFFLIKFPIQNIELNQPEMIKEHISFTSIEGVFSDSDETKSLVSFFNSSGVEMESKLEPFVILSDGKKIFFKDALITYGESIEYEVIRLKENEEKWSFNFTVPDKIDVKSLGFKMTSTITSTKPIAIEQVTDPLDDDFEPYRLIIKGDTGHLIYDFEDIKDYVIVNHSASEVIIDLKGEKSIYLDPMITFVSGDPEDPSIAEMGREKFGLCWHDGTANQIHYMVYNTNGTVFLADTTIDSDTGTSGGRCIISAFNSTALAVGWSERSVAVNYIYYQVWDDAGNNLTSVYQITDQADLGSEDNVFDLKVFNDTAAVFCWQDFEVAQDASYNIVHSDGVVENTIDVHGDTGVARARISCSVFNSSTFLYLLGEDLTDDVSYWVIDTATGTKYADDVNIDASDAGVSFNDVNAIEYTGNIQTSRFVYTKYDAGDDDVYYGIWYVNGSNVVDRVSLLQDTSSSRNSVGLASGDGSTNFTLGWSAATVDDDFYNTKTKDGNDIKAATTIDADADSAKLGIGGRSLGNNISICPEKDVFIYAWQTKTPGGNFSTFYINGSTWDGLCPAPAGVDTCSPSNPLTGNYEFDCADKCIISSDLDAGGYNVRLFTDFVGSLTIASGARLYNYNEIYIGDSCELIIEGELG